MEFIVHNYDPNKSEFQELISCLSIVAFIFSLIILCELYFVGICNSFVEFISIILLMSYLGLASNNHGFCELINWIRKIELQKSSKLSSRM